MRERSQRDPCGRSTQGSTPPTDSIGACERSDSLRRRRDPTAADHPHERQATRAGGQQADPVLRASRTWPRPASPRSGSSPASTGPEIREAVGDGSDFGALGHLHPPGRAAGSGPLRADRPGVPGRRRLRHVPRRQPAASGHRRVRSASSRPTESVPPPSDDAGSRRHACGPDPAGPGPDPERFGVAELEPERRSRSCDWSRSPRNPPSDLALVGVYLFDLRIHDAVARHRAVRTRRARDHRRHPMAHRQRPPGAPRGARRLVEGHGQAGSTPRGQSPGARRLEPRIDGTVDARLEGRGQVVIEAGAELIVARVRGPAVIGAGHPARAQLHRPVHLRSPATARSATPRSSTRSCCEDSRIVGIPACRTHSSARRSRSPGSAADRPPPG